MPTNDELRAIESLVTLAPVDDLGWTEDKW
jgi:hypothetical protein